jgi:hypothetical protein
MEQGEKRLLCTDLPREKSGVISRFAFHPAWAEMAKG